MKSTFPTASKVVWLGILVGVFILASTGHAAPEAAEGTGSGGGLMMLAALVAMVALGSPLFVIIGVLAALAFLMYGDDYTVGACTTLSTEAVCGFDTFPAKMAELSSKPVLLAIPFFVVSGAIMSAGDIANRLVNFARAMVGWMPGGLAVATVGGCMFFAAISGSSPVTVIAIGTMMFPALTKAGYSETFSMGLVTTAGSLGILIPPSIPMLVFAIVAGAASPIDIGELFMAGIIPGLLIGGLLSVYSMVIAGKTVRERDDFSFRGVYDAFLDGFWAISLPVLILGGIYTGLFTATEAAAVSVVYSLIVELFIHRTLTWSQIPKVLSESAVLMGTLLIIMALAFGLNDFLVEQQVPQLAVEWITGMNLTPIQFLLIVNLFLLVVGALMDSISAILVIAPLLTPIAATLGIDPIHMGVIFIVNLEIGYLTPPIGINLFVASAAFERPMGLVIKSVVPFIVLMFVGLGIVTYVPTVSLGAVNVLLRGKPMYESLPDAQPVGAQGGPLGGGPLAGGGAAQGLPSGDGDGKPRTMVDITADSTQLLTLCFIAEDVLDEEDIAPADRVKAWRDGFEEEDLTNPGVIDIADRAIEKAGTPEAYAQLRTEVDSVLNTGWKCEALETILGPATPDGAGKPDEPDEPGSAEEDDAEGETGDDQDAVPAKGADAAGGEDLEEATEPAQDEPVPD